MFNDFMSFPAKVYLINMYLLLCLSLKRNNARTLAVKLTNVRESFILQVCLYDSPEEVIDYVTFL